MVNRIKNKWWSSIAMIVYWAIYLTLTMVFFERFGIHPSAIPYGVVGWTIIVELPRVIVGWVISIPIFFKK